MIMEIYLKNILWFSLILLVLALVVAVIQIVLMLLDLRWATHEIRKRARAVVDIYDAVALIGSTNWKTFLARLKKVMRRFTGGENE